MHMFFARLRETLSACVIGAVARVASRRHAYAPRPVSHAYWEQNIFQFAVV